MSSNIPAAIARYLECQCVKGSERFADCFSATAVVRDEGQVFNGRAAIAEWKHSTDAKYDVRITPLGISRQGDEFTLLAHLVGDFPGGQVDLIHRFTVRNDLIEALEIRLPVELEGRRALVTGGTKGIGAAVVEQLVAAGARVLVAARNGIARRHSARAAGEATGGGGTRGVPGIAPRRIDHGCRVRHRWRHVADRLS